MSGPNVIIKMQVSLMDFKKSDYTQRRKFNIVKDYDFVNSNILVVLENNCIVSYDWDAQKHLNKLCFLSPLMIIPSNFNIKSVPVVLLSDGTLFDVSGIGFKGLVKEFKNTN